MELSVIEVESLPSFQLRLSSFFSLSYATLRRGTGSILPSLLTGTHTHACAHTHAHTFRRIFLNSSFKCSLVSCSCQWSVFISRWQAGLWSMVVSFSSLSKTPCSHVIALYSLNWLLIKRPDYGHTLLTLCLLLALGTVFRQTAQTQM